MSLYWECLMVWKWVSLRFSCSDYAHDHQNGKKVSKVANSTVGLSGGYTVSVTYSSITIDRDLPIEFIKD